MSSRGSLGSFPGRIWENSRAHCRSLHFASLRSKNISREGPLTPQISPLRCAPVEMTKGRAALPLSVVAEQKVFLITLGGPKAHDFSGRDGKRLLFSHLFLEEPLSPLSSRPELRRSVVERSAVSAVLGSVFRYAGALFPVAST